MNDIASIPYLEAEFDKDGMLLKPVQISEGTTDLFVFSHGWNNNRQEAQSLYHNFFTNFKEVAPRRELSSRELAIIGVIWPSKGFDELVAVESTGDAAVGGAFVGGFAPDPKSEKALLDKLDRIKSFFNQPAQQQVLEDVRALLPDLETKGSVRAEFVKKIRSLLNPNAINKEDASDIFFRCDPEDLMEQLRIPEEDTETEVISGGGAAFSGPGAPPPNVGGAAGISDLFTGFKTAAMNVLNYTTYYEMKNRAGTVGKNGVAPLIDKLSAQVDRIHLLGHSFGGRVVTATAANSTTHKIRSMTLLQAAFSHNGFSQSMNGFFRSVVDRRRVTGPIVVTHTKNDKAVGVAYPIASRLAGQVAAKLGDENDKFGGLGRNGAQKMNTGEVIVGKLLSVGANYAFAAGKFFNAEASDFIKDHGDVTGKEIAYAVAIASLSAS